MTPSELRARTKKFAVDAIRVGKAVPRDPINDEIASQMTDAASSGAAAYRAACRARVAEEGDNLPIAWLRRDERYVEKLATPDVTIADLIGDVDPVKAATLKKTFADEEVIHYGIVPRTNRGIFAINELPDLAPRIQVGLLNILEERDLQIRGFPVRIPLDVVMVFSANPEDYTNRGNIITPLKDRIASQILTHYPRDLATATALTRRPFRHGPFRGVEASPEMDRIGRWCRANRHHRGRTRGAVETLRAGTRTSAAGSGTGRAPRSDTRDALRRTKPH